MEAWTIALALTYLVWAIMVSPEPQRKLEEEVANLTHDFDNVETENLPLLNAVIMESLRLYSSIPGGLPRAGPKECATLGDYHSPKVST